MAALLSTLLAIAIPAYNRFMQNVKTTRAIAEIRAIEKDIIAVIVDSNTLPNSLNDIGHGLLRDPWGNLYQYLNFANAGTPRQDDLTFDLNTDFDIYSLGPNGVSHTNVKHANSLDDVVRANDGGWIGTGVNF